MISVHFTTHSEFLNAPPLILNSADCVSYGYSNEVPVYVKCASGEHYGKSLAKADRGSMPDPIALRKWCIEMARQHTQDCSTTLHIAQQYWEWVSSHD